MVAEGASRATILVVDDEDLDRSILLNILRPIGYTVETASNGREALERLETLPVSVVITDLRMPQVDGFELLRTLNARAQVIPAIVLTNFGDVGQAVTVVHELQAFWFLEKPAPATALTTLVDRAIKYGELQRGAELLQRELSQKGVLGEMIGNSRAMRQVFTLIQRAAPTLAPVLITGESGTGKEMAARALHRLSPRKAGPFVAINCAALPADLIESELFGYEKGAFTGAVGRHQGCFEQAHRGTLFLDEIGEMPRSMQDRLLRVLEDSSVRRVGGSSEISVDVRIIAATNRAIDGPDVERALRTDLLYRLNVFNVHLPPLRERKEDLPDLTQAIIGVLNQKHDCSVLGAHPDVLNRLAAHSWPGNVRELRNILEWAVITARSGLLQTWHLPKNFGETSTASVPVEAPGKMQIDVGRNFEEVRRLYLEETLKSVKDDRRKAAKLLGISLRTLYNWLPEKTADAKVAP